MRRSPVIVTSLFCVALAVSGLADPVPAQQPQREDAVSAGFGTLLWSVMDDCFDDWPEPVTLCLKSKALTALNRALSKPTVPIVDGVALSTRASKSMQDAAEPRPDETADLAALDAVQDLDNKSNMLDDMLASRIGRLLSTRTIVLDEEGRGKKNKDKTLQHALMMGGLMTAGMIGPMVLKIIALMAGKALMFSKIALVLSAIMLLKKLMQPQHSSYEMEAIPHNIALRHSTVDSDAHQQAYAGYNHHH